MEMTNRITNMASSIFNKIVTQNDNLLAFEKMTHNQLIQIADYVREVFKGGELNSPSLCVVGSQSSGKSTTFNSLMGMDILPNGKSIVTRTPIHIRLIHVANAKNITVDFFDKDDCQKIISTFSIDINTPNDQVMQIRCEIQRLTELYAGHTKNVVDIPIDIMIKSPNVPNLSIIDLPGLTNIALTDQGQPETIKQDIENMLIKYIKNPRTLILSIISATIDVESDMGLGLIKRFDPEFKRTIGVLTKVDMLKDSNVLNYLMGNISKNLQLGYGYYAVRNRSTDEIKLLDVKGGIVLENKFFSETEPYKTSEYKNKMGSVNLGNKLSEILLKHLRSCLPHVMDEINNADITINAQLDELGNDYPVTESAKYSTLNILLHDFSREYNGALKDRGAIYNAGARISNAFKVFGNNMDKLDPFSIDPDRGQILTDDMINNIVRDYNGLHMPDATISSGILEKCLSGIEITINKTQVNNNPLKNSILNNQSSLFNDQNNMNIIQTIKYEPIKIMKDPFSNCVKDIHIILTELVDNILSKDKFSRFPKLCTRIKEIVNSQIIPNQYEIVHNKVSEMIQDETDCIWTDDQKFRCEVLPNLVSRSKDGHIEPKNIRIILSSYFCVIKNISKHNIHKKIYSTLINGTIDDVNSKLLNTIITKSDINVLLEENKDKTFKREKLIKLKEKINNIKTLIININ